MDNKFLTVRVWPLDDGGLGQGFNPVDYKFRTQAEVSAFVSGIKAGGNDCRWTQTVDKEDVS